MKPWRFLRRRKPADTVGQASNRRPVTFSLDMATPLINGLPPLGSVAPRIDRREALQVPAVLRARNLICGALGTLPIRVHAPDRSIVTNVPYLLPSPDPDIPQSVMITQTVEDLLFEGVAWWRVTKFGWHGYPAEARRVPTTSVTVGGSAFPAEKLVSPDELFPVDGQVYIDGVPVPDSEIIRFDSPNPPLLVHAARAIRTCLLLDQAAALYAKDPLPLGYFSPKDGSDPANDDEVQAVLDAWEDARAQRSWGYVGAALDAKSLSFNPEQLQLADQRQHAVLEIARAAGVDAEDLGVSTTSRTYQNGETRRQDFIDFTLGGYVSAIQDRLSMRDVLPRGYAAKVDFAGFLRSDTLTRMQTYEAGLKVGAYSEQEIRELEDKPPLPPSQRPSAQQPPAPPTPPAVDEQPAAQEAQMSHPIAAEPARPSVRFSDTDPVHVTFASHEMAATFRADTGSRTITGLLMPWNAVGQSGFSRWRFAPDSLHWSDTGRVKLFRDHDYTQPVGVATDLKSTDTGLFATFKVARGAAGDEVLSLAQDGVLDGLSAGVDFGPNDDWQTDPADDSVRLVRSGRLMEGSVTALPAFDGARVSAVAANRTGKDTAMGDQNTQTTAEPQTQPAAPATGPDLTAFTAGVSEALSSAVTEAFNRLPTPQVQGSERRPVPAGRVQVTHEPPVYTFNGHGSSLVRDTWHARNDGNPDATNRLRKFRAQQDEVLAHFQNRPDLAFAVDTTTAASVIPPGYRPDLYVTQLLQGRPLVDSVSRGVLTDATPFVLPKFASATNAADDHTEGTNPTAGSMTINSVTVTPGAVSGLFQLTREIVDSANPAIDAIALTAMREAYAQQTEAKLYAELNGANGQAGTITNGTVPSGAQVLAVGDGTTGKAPEDLIAGVRGQMAAYPFRRFAAPDRMHISQEATSAFAGAVGTDGRPLLPSVGATNTAGIGNAASQGWFVDGLAARPTWSMSGSAVGDADVLLYNQADVWAWESPLLTFRFEERNGPALIDLALFGYFATRLIRPVGLSAVRYVQAAG